MAIDTYITEAGESFKADSLVLAGALARLGFKGSALGMLIRGEEPIPVDRTTLVLEAGAKFRATTTPKSKLPKGPNIDKLWEALTLAVGDSTKGVGRDAGDLFLQSGVEPEGFTSWLQDASGDMAQSFEDFLNPKASDLCDKFYLALQTGIYVKSSPYEKWNLRERKNILGEIYADYWSEEVSKAWSVLRRNPKEMARLLAFRKP